jgi:hypothetical protein
MLSGLAGSRYPRDRTSDVVLYGQQFAFDVAGALEAVVALAERAGIEVGGVEAGGRQHVRVQRGAERQMA